MSVTSGPPQLPPDSPGSSNEYEDLLRRAIVVSTDGYTTKVTMNQTALGLGQRPIPKRNDQVTDLIDLSSPETHRTDKSLSVMGKNKNDFRPLNFKQIILDTQRQQLSQIPSLQQLLTTSTSSLNEQYNIDNQLTPRECDDPVAHTIYFVILNLYPTI
ncbi:hypothetical protein I4U23_008598 [Adineta vaga]|nr:hypothetical protein I4U23_008598 [Adineta vaga]